MTDWPQRIICMTEETVETLYLLDADDRIAGISGFTVRPARARKEKPKVSAFTSAKIPKILELEPDLVLGFSDMQAEIAADLIRAGVEVYVFNHRTVDGILRMIGTLGRLIGKPEQATNLTGQYRIRMETLRRQTTDWTVRPKIYFEEWDDPMISGIRWVSELISIAGGIDCCEELSVYPDAQRRIIADPQSVVERAPDIIIGSWCGKKFRPEKVVARNGWQQIPAVQNGQLFEIKSAHILQPGPAALTDGLDQLHQIIAGWYNAQQFG